MKLFVPLLSPSFSMILSGPDLPPLLRQSQLMFHFPLRIHRMCACLMKAPVVLWKDQ